MKNLLMIIAASALFTTAPAQTSSVAADISYTYTITEPTVTLPEDTLVTAEDRDLAKELTADVMTHMKNTISNAIAAVPEKIKQLHEEFDRVLQFRKLLNTTGIQVIVKNNSAFDITLNISSKTTVGSFIVEPASNSDFEKIVLPHFKEIILHRMPAGVSFVLVEQPEIVEGLFQLTRRTMSEVDSLINKHKKLMIIFDGYEWGDPEWGASVHRVTLID
jgi:hypothetical protein